MEIKHIVEALLFAAKRPLSVSEIRQLFPEFEQPLSDEIKDALDAIGEDYRQRPIELRRVASGYRFQIKETMSPWISRLFEEKPQKYSRALLETLAIIAYRQPATRGEIEDIRGVAVSSGILQTLLEREWIRVVAHKETPGRPALYGTTSQFLDDFNLTSIGELPPLQVIQDLDLNQQHEHEKITSEQQTQTQTAQSSDNEQSATSA
ncbi:MAG: SMC-Scp complex subunit ScpB [Gammaproteobacteria bacterium]